MKKLYFLLLLLTCLGTAAQAQDQIITKAGEEIQAKVLEITPSELRYKRFDYLEGPTFVIYSKDVLMVKFENGVTQSFVSPGTAPAPAPKPATPPVKAPVAPTPPPAAPREPAPSHNVPLVAPNPVQLDGPRAGVTYIGNGKMADKLEEKYSAGPVISQFGWQFENRLFTAGNGMSGLVEWIPLIGGLDQGLFLPSMSAIIGLRTGGGMEVGVGPNVSVAGAGLVVAAGFTVRTEYVYFPFNFAVVPSRHGARYSLMTGFNLRKR